MTTDPPLNVPGVIATMEEYWRKRGASDLDVANALDHSAAEMSRRPISAHVLSQLLPAMRQRALDLRGGQSW